MSMEARPKRKAPRKPPVDTEGERRRRLEMEALNGALARKRCSGCATVGAWRVYDVEKTHGRVRYIKCIACGYCDQTPIIVKENTDEATATGSQ